MPSDAASTSVDVNAFFCNIKGRSSFTADASDQLFGPLLKERGFEGKIGDFIGVAEGSHTRLVSLIIGPNRERSEYTSLKIAREEAKKKEDAGRAEDEGEKRDKHDRHKVSTEDKGGEKKLKGGRKQKKVMKNEAGKPEKNSQNKSKGVSKTNDVHLFFNKSKWTHRSSDDDIFKIDSLPTKEWLDGRFAAGCFTHNEMGYCVCTIVIHGRCKKPKSRSKQPPLTYEDKVRCLLGNYQMTKLLTFRIFQNGNRQRREAVRARHPDLYLWGFQRGPRDPETQGRAPRDELSTIS
jgi:hypothetical protein